MDAYVLAALSALWLGVLTSISPCPLATNIAAVSFIGRRVDNTRYVLYSGLFYAAGRLVSYVGIGVLAVAGILSIPGWCAGWSFATAMSALSLKWMRLRRQSSSFGGKTQNLGHQCPAVRVLFGGEGSNKAVRHPADVRIELWIEVRRVQHRLMHFKRS